MVPSLHLAWRSKPRYANNGMQVNLNSDRHILHDYSPGTETLIEQDLHSLKVWIYLLAAWTDLLKYNILLRYSRVE